MGIYSASSRTCKEQFMSNARTCAKLKHAFAKNLVNSALAVIDNSRMCKSLICRKYQTKMQCELLHNVDLIKVSRFEKISFQHHIKDFGGNRNDS
jgi:hypothetical protein